MANISYIVVDCFNLQLGNKITRDDGRFICSELFHTVSPVVFDPETRHGIIKDFVDTREGAASKKTN